MAAEIIPTTTGVLIKMQAPQAPHMNVSPSSSISGGATTTSSTKMSMTTSTASTKTSTTKITKTTSTSSSYSAKSTSSSTISHGGNSTTSSSFKTIKTSSNSGSFSDDIASMFGINANQEMDKMKSIMSDQMSRMHSERFSLQSSSTSSAPESSLVQFDPKSIMDFADNDNLRFNFDMSNFASESVNVKTVGNKIEVHAQRKTKTADGETSEEYSRSYEMPTTHELAPDKVTSSLFKEGVLTVQLPVSEAMQGVEC